MNESKISRRRKKSSGFTKNELQDIDKMMGEVGGAIDQAMHQAALDALTEDARAGRSTPVWEDGKVVLKPAAQLLAQLEAEEKLAKPRQTSRQNPQRKKAIAAVH